MRACMMHVTSGPVFGCTHCDEATDRHARLDARVEELEATVAALAAEVAEMRSIGGRNGS